MNKIKDNLQDNYRPVLEKTREIFAAKNPEEMARNGAVSYLSYAPMSLRRFVVPYLGRIFEVRWPTGEVYPWGEEQEAPFGISLVILHYLSDATGEPPQGNWLSFIDLWGGRSFDLAFRERALKPLARTFHENSPLFEQAVKALGGIKSHLYKNGYLIFGFPNIPLLCFLHPGDEEVATTANILFDGVANNYLVTEDLAVVGETLSEFIIETYNANG